MNDATRADPTPSDPGGRPHNFQLEKDGKRNSKRRRRDKRIKYNRHGQRNYIEKVARV